MDFSVWPTTHEFFSSSNITEKERERLLLDRELNKKKIGLYSDEVGGKIVKEACLVKAKSYIIQLHGDESQANLKLAFKGCRTRILDIKYNYAKRFLLGLEKSQILYPHVSIESKRHNLLLRKTQKVVCNRQFLKRYLLQDGITSLSFGHYLIPIYETLYYILDEVVKNST